MIKEGKTYFFAGDFISCDMEGVEHNFIGEYFTVLEVKEVMGLYAKCRMDLDASEVLFPVEELEEMVEWGIVVDTEEMY